MSDSPALCIANCIRLNFDVAQAAQVRKTCFVTAEEADASPASAYDADTHHSCTIYAGTYVQQVCHLHTVWVPNRS